MFWLFLFRVTDGDKLCAVHEGVLEADGTVVRGDAVSRAEQAEDGRIRLVEDFAVDGVDHVSVCLQV